MNVFGGEDRFWLGPEGGQFALYFRPGDPFDLDHWQVPRGVRLGRMGRRDPVGNRGPFHKHMTLVNYSRTPFDIDVERTVRMLGAAAMPPRSPGSLRHSASAWSRSNRRTTSRTAERRPGSTDVGPRIRLDPRAVQPGADDDDRDPVRPGPRRRSDRSSTTRYFGKVPRDRLSVATGSSSSAATASSAARSACRRDARSALPAATTPPRTC